MSFSSGFKTQALIAPTLAMFTLFGCGTSGEPPSGNVEVQATNVSSLSGEQLYRGIILADGPVADLLPEIRDNVKLDNFITDKEQLATISKANDQVVDQVRKVRPDFFDSFKKDIQSGDHLLIRRGMQDALTLTQAVVSKLPGAGDVDKQAGDEQTDAKRIESFEQLKAEIAAEVHQSKIVQSHAAVATEVAVAVAVHIAVVHNVVLFTILAAVFAAVFGLSPDQSTVLREQLEHSIATNLRG
jgi:SdpC family antimicrobial peptide